MALREIEEANKVMVQVINHFWNHHEEYDESTLERSMMIMQLDPLEAQEQLLQAPELARNLGIQQAFVLEESEPETVQSQEELSSEEENQEETTETPVFRSNMNRQDNTRDPESPNFFRRPKEEQGETSQQGADRKKRKMNTPIFMPSRPKMVAGNHLDPTTLNLDCSNNRKELIDRWAGEMGLIIQTNPEAYLDANKVRSLLEHKSTGIAAALIKGTEWAKTNAEDALQEILEAFYVVFLGLNFSTDKARELERIANNAKAMLTKMQLCDICELGAFNCAYEKYFYKLDQTEWTKYIEMYLMKIPIVGEKATNIFKEKAVPPMHMSLGYAMKIVTDEIGTICELNKKQKRLKKFNKKCCSFLTEPTTEFGCKPEKKFRKKQKPYKKKFYKKKSFKRFKKKFTPGKYFKKPTGKAKFCPKGKKNCRCWICSEEGHYANECPNRKQYPEKVKLLEIAHHNGLEPLEEIYSDYEEVYCFIKEEPPDSSTESDDESEDSTESSD